MPSYYLKIVEYCIEYGDVYRKVEENTYAYNIEKQGVCTKKSSNCLCLSVPFFLALGNKIFFIKQPRVC